MFTHIQTRSPGIRLIAIGPDTWVNLNEISLIEALHHPDDGKASGCLISLKNGQDARGTRSVEDVIETINSIFRDKE